MAADQPNVNEAEPASAVSDATAATKFLGTEASLGEGTEADTPATARVSEVPAAYAATADRPQAAAPGASPIETTKRAEPGPEAQAPTIAAATQDAQRRPLRSADGLAEAAVLDDTLAAHLTEERRTLAVARQALADASDEAAASAEAVNAAKAAARNAAAEAESLRMTSRAEGNHLIGSLALSPAFRC